MALVLARFGFGFCMLLAALVLLAAATLLATRLVGWAVRAFALERSQALASGVAIFILVALALWGCHAVGEVLYGAIGATALVGGAPVAMGLSETLGGIPALSAVFAALTGLVGALTGKYLFDLLGPVRGRQDWADRGFALGTVSHGIGAARAIQVNADAGAYAGLALGLQVILASLLIPVAFRLAAGLGGS
ncbi:LrgB family protein [Bordetella bronchiseptica]|uniref:LrgB family protein n=1 Tax=Bordetella bronchiseptica TaxID=518 RepID=UPI00049F5ECA|nr:LrgB family protein [Bordetella bronchiseptica]KDB72705.1 LrgB-like protein [Bordetella bronchiseptica B20-10725633]